MDIKPDSCSECKKILDLGIPITIEFGYGSEYDGNEEKFCSVECLIVFLKKIK